MYKVLLIVDFPGKLLYRQIPNSKRKWGNCEFYINEPLTNPDFVFFFDMFQKNYELLINPQNSCLITGEPPSVKFYSHTYTGQFNWLLSCQKNVYERFHGIKSHPLLPWLVGIKQIGIDIGNYMVDNVLDYDYFASHNQRERGGNNKIAVVTSNKRITKGHCKRLDFIERLEELLPGLIDKYGNGFETIVDKYDVYKKYKYLLIIENCKYPNYWTEKIADAFLANCFPFYIGAPNIGDFFDKKSVLCLDYDNPVKSSELIKNAISLDYYDKYFDNILTSKKKILEDYNIFHVLSKFVNTYYVEGRKEIVSFKAYSTDLRNKICWRLYKYFNIEI